MKQRTETKTYGSTSAASGSGDEGGEGVRSRGAITSRDRNLKRENTQILVQFLKRLNRYVTYQERVGSEWRFFKMEAARPLARRTCHGCESGSGHFPTRRKAKFDSSSIALSIAFQKIPAHSTCFIMIVCVLNICFTRSIVFFFSPTVRQSLVKKGILFSL